MLVKIINMVSDSDFELNETLNLSNIHGICILCVKSCLPTTYNVII